MKSTTTLLLLSVLLTSCYHVYYAPNSAHAPLLQEKGEVRVNALYAAGADSEFNGGDLQFAYGIGKNVGLMVNGFAAGKEEDTGEYMEKGNGTYGEAALGYFGNLDARKKWVGEIYGGYGRGSVTNEYGLNDRSRVRISKLFIQPAIGYRSRYFEAALAPKLSLVNWKAKEIRINSTEHDYEKDDMKAISAHPNFFAFEPALLLRGGGEEFKVQAGLSFSSNRNNDAVYSEGLTESLTGSIGISINIRPKGQKN